MLCFFLHSDEFQWNVYTIFAVCAQVTKKILDFFFSPIKYQQQPFRYTLHIPWQHLATAALWLLQHHSLAMHPYLQKFTNNILILVEIM